MQHLANPHPFRSAVKQGWTTLLGAARPRKGVARKHGRALAAHTVAKPPVLPAAAPSIDPVALTMLAVNRLAPATLRSSTNGRALTITVPDAHVAEIFRAALDQMQKVRSTDRLVDVVVAAEPRAVREMSAQ